MAFTDSQLRKVRQKTHGQPEMVELWCIDLEGLLSRLEASEQLNEAWDAYDLGTMDKDDFQQAIIRWKTSCGH